MREVIVLQSTEPLPNKMLKIKKLYIVCLVVMALGFFHEAFLGYGILALIVVYIIDYYGTRTNRNLLRQAKFKYNNEVSEDELLQKLQSALISKYSGKMLLEKNQNGKIMITYDGHIYDVLINQDNTFCLWWRMSLGKAFISFRDYKSYRKILAAMGILGYEIQKCCGVIPDVGTAGQISEN